MSKVICIGECSLNMVLSASGMPQGSMPGGRIANAAVILATDGIDVLMASDAAADPIGDAVVDFVASAGVDIRSIDRFTEGRTPMNVYVNNADAYTLTRYESYPETAFDIIWPRIDPGDIVVYGGFYAIDARMRSNMVKLLAYAAERHAIMVYVPGFPKEQEPRMTRIMPQIFENLEWANVVITRSKDIELIFNNADAASCYANHIDFYCRSMLNIDAASATMTYNSGKETARRDIDQAVCYSTMWNAGAIAGVVKALVKHSYSADELERPSDNMRNEILDTAIACATTAVNNLTADWQIII